MQIGLDCHYIFRVPKTDITRCALDHTCAAAGWCGFWNRSNLAVTIDVDWWMSFITVGLFQDSAFLSSGIQRLEILSSELASSSAPPPKQPLASAVYPFLRFLYVSSCIF